METRTELENEVIRAGRPRRIRLRYVIPGAILLLAISGYVGWVVAWHVMATTWLESNSYRVDWHIEKENWKKGGATSVRAAVDNSFFTSGSSRAEIKYLDSLHRVESLDLAQVFSLSDGDIEVVGRLTDLTYLSLDQVVTRSRYQAEPVQLTDATLARLANLTRLKELYLGGHRFTDAGMPHLARLTDLEVLDLQDSPITDAGLEPLKRLTRLRQLNLIGTKVTPGGVKALEAALPRTAIHFEPTPASAP